MDESEAFDRLDAAFEVSIAEAARGPPPLTVLFSGGVDSGLLAWELRRRDGIRLLVIGLPSSPDRQAARASAAELGSSLQEIEIEPRTVEAARDRWVPHLRDLPRSRAVPLLGLALAMASAGPGALVCGQGADELFLGYAHFRGLDSRAAAERSDADLARLRETDVVRAHAIAGELGARLECPYLEPAFVRAAQSIPIALRLPVREPKALFRRWAVHRGLPRSVATRPKRALQYGTGIDRVLRRLERPGDGPTRAATEPR